MKIITVTDTEDGFATDEGVKIPIGDHIVNAGDRVYSNGKVIFGHETGGNYPPVVPLVGIPMICTERNGNTTTWAYRYMPEDEPILRENFHTKEPLVWNPDVQGLQGYDDKGWMRNIFVHNKDYAFMLMNDPFGIQFDLMAKETRSAVQTKILYDACIGDEKGDLFFIGSARQRTSYGWGHYFALDQNNQVIYGPDAAACEFYCNGELISDIGAGIEGIVSNIESTKGASWLPQGFILSLSSAEMYHAVTFPDGRFLVKGTGILHFKRDVYVDGWPVGADNVSYGYSWSIANGRGRYVITGESIHYYGQTPIVNEWPNKTSSPLADGCYYSTFSVPQMSRQGINIYGADGTLAKSCDPRIESWGWDGLNFEWWNPKGVIKLYNNKYLINFNQTDRRLATTHGSAPVFMGEDELVYSCQNSRFYRTMNIERIQNGFEAMFKLINGE